MFKTTAMRKSPIAPKAFILLLSLLVLSSCVKEPLEVVDEMTQEEPQDPEDENDASAIVNLVIPEGFEFSTSTNTTITINDNATNAIYTVYSYDSTPNHPVTVDIINDEGEAETISTFETDELNQVLFTGRPVNGVLEYTIPTPSYYTQIYLRRKEGNSWSSAIVDISGGTAIYTHSNTSAAARKAEVARFKQGRAPIQSMQNSIKIDSLFSVNGSGQLFTINPLNGNLTN